MNDSDKEDGIISEHSEFYPTKEIVHPQLVRETNDEGAVEDKSRVISLFLALAISNMSYFATVILLPIHVDR